MQDNQDQKALCTFRNLSGHAQCNSKHIDSANGDNIIQILSRCSLLWEYSGNEFEGDQK